MTRKNKVEAQTIDQLLADHEIDPGFIKTDVEGGHKKSCMSQK